MNNKLFSISLILIGFSLLAGISQYLPSKIQEYQQEPPLLLPKQNPTPKQQALNQPLQLTAFPPLSQKKRNLAYLVLGGDIMFSRNIGHLNKQQGYDRIFGSGKFNPISKFTNCTHQNCLLLFNLESLFHPRDNDIPFGGFTFRANEKNIEVLQELRNPSPQQAAPYSQGIPLVLSLANNHTINVWYEGIVATNDLLHWWGDISHIGAGATPEGAHHIAQYTLNETCEEWTCTEMSICSQAYSYDGKENLKVWGGQISRNSLNKQDIIADLEEMKRLNCDVKALILHRGAEYKISPLPRQRTLAQELIDNGADVIIGGHSHIPGEFEKYKGKYIFYSLGNFIFDQGRGKTAKGAEFDYIYDYELSRKTTPTYISLLVGLQLQKFKSWVRITLNQIEMSRMTNGVHSPLDSQTYEEVLQRIKKV